MVSCPLQTVTVLLPFQFLFLISFSSMIARTSKTMLNKSDENGYFSLFLILQEMLSVFHLSMTLAMGLSYTLGYIPSMPTFWRDFIISGC